MIILLKNKSNNLVLWDVRRSTRSDYNGGFTKEYNTDLNLYGFSCLGYTKILELNDKEELNDYPEFFL